MSSGCPGGRVPGSREECVEFLQWALPRMGMRWAGFRKVRGQVCKRLRRRVAELELPGLGAYRAHLERDPAEWEVLEALTRVTISRFNRDRGVFSSLRDEVLPELASRGGQVEVWSAGCASGEEPYTLAIMWQLELAPRFPGVELRILATDACEAMLARARRGCYPAGSLRELPEWWRAMAFAGREGLHCLLDPFKAVVRFERHDIRSAPPNGPLDLVLCRNLAFTYFEDDVQRRVAESLGHALRPGGALVLGAHEELPAGVVEFEPWGATERIYRRRG